MSSTTEEKTQEIKKPTTTKRKVRKARVQVEKDKGPVFQREEGGQDYNIWYHKHIGSKRERFGVELEKSATRTNISKDSGWSIGCSQKDPYFCLFFAKGECSQGPDCKFMHRLPTKQDEERIPITKDVFGRDKYAVDREDMMGVGSFNRECKTLYVVNLKNLPGNELDESLKKHFKEFGKLEFIRSFPEKCFAFIKYELRLCAEFAKEAMNLQSLDNGEVIQVKWSQDDVNPMVQSSENLAKRQKLMDKIEQKGIDIKDLPFNYPQNYKPSDTKLPENLEEIKKKFGEQIQMNQEFQNYTQVSKGTDNLDYNNYVHSTFKDAKLREKKREAEQEAFNQQSKMINSKVSAPYPDTDKQYEGMSDEQKQYMEYYKQYQEYIQQYSNYDPEIYKQFKQQEEK
eukprot:gene7400-11724_t